MSPELMLEIQIWVTKFCIYMDMAAFAFVLDYLQGKYIDG